MNANAAKNKTAIPPMIPAAIAPALLLLEPDTAEGVLLAFAPTTPPGITLEEVDAPWVEVMVTVTGVGGVVVVVEREAGLEEELDDALRDDEGSVVASTIKTSRNNGAA